MSINSIHRGSRRTAGCRSLVAAMASTALVLTACGGSDSESSGETGVEGEGGGEQITLEFASALPEGGLNYGFDWWAEEVELRTDGRVTFVPNYGASLFGVQETFAALGDGRVDLGWLGSAFFGAEMPLWAVNGVPFQTYNPIGHSGADYQMWQENEAFQAEWEAQGMRPIMFQPWSPGVMGSSQPVDGLEDLDGQRLRVVGFVAPSFEAVGVEPVALPTEEMYEGVQRGVVDGYAPWSFDRSLVDIGVTEVAPYTVDIGVGHYASIPIAMSDQTWSELPEDVQQVMTEVAEEFMFEQSIDLYRKQQDETCEAILDGGGSVSQFTDEQVAAFEEQASSVSLEAWLSNAEEQGVDREDAEAFREERIAAYESIAAEHEYESGIEACANR